MAWGHCVIVIIGVFSGVLLEFVRQSLWLGLSFYINVFSYTFAFFTSLHSPQVLFSFCLHILQTWCGWKLWRGRKFFFLCLEKLAAISAMTFGMPLLKQPLTHKVQKSRQIQLAGCVIYFGGTSNHMIPSIKVLWRLSADYRKEDSQDRRTHKIINRSPSNF